MSVTQPTLPPLLMRYRDEIIRGLKEAVCGSSLLFRMMRFSLGLEDPSGQALDGLGKALRPTLCLFACEALGGEWRKALPAAVALELVHNFSLVHDDIQDGAKERRHRPTVWAVWGVGQAINVGDALHALSSLVLCQVSDTEALRLLSQATLEMIEGQHLDLEYERCLDLTVQDHLKMISKKTGALMACALELGALLGGADPKTREIFKNAGQDLGLAFQIRDDTLGIWGSEESTGKPASDLWKKKRTLPVIYALENTQSRTRVLEYLKSEHLTEEDINALKALLEEIGAKRYAQGLATSYARRALQALKGASLPSWAWKEAQELVDFLVHREL